MNPLAAGGLGAAAGGLLGYALGKGAGEREAREEQDYSGGDQGSYGDGGGEYGGGKLGDFGGGGGGFWGGDFGGGGGGPFDGGAFRGGRSGAFSPVQSIRDKNS